MIERAWFGDVHRGGEPGRMRYALTFDDGPLDGATDRVLDVLCATHTPAAFFVIGRFALRWPHLVRRMHDEGHVVGNHTFDHWRHAMWRGPRYWRQQLDRTDDAVEAAIGRRPALFRPPLGVRTPVNAAAARAAGYACVMWTRRAFDGVSTTADRIVGRLTKTATDGDVLVLHDGREPASRRDPTPTIDALPRVIEAFAARGLAPVRLDTLLGVAAYRTTPVVSGRFA